MHTDAIEREKPSTKVIRAVAAYEDVEPTKFKNPLYDVIDLEALDMLFAKRSNGNPRGNGQVVFTYGDHEVTVFSDGEVEVDPVDDA